MNWPHAMTSIGSRCAIGPDPRQTRFCFQSPHVCENVLLTPKPGHHAAQKHESLLSDLRKKDESYARREQKYQEEIEEMREKLSTLVLPQQKDDRILTKIEIMHEQILSQIDRLDDAGKSTCACDSLAT